MTDIHERLENIEDDLYRTHPDNPGAILRLDRMERLLSTMLKIGGALGSLGIAWKLLEVIGEMLRSRVTPG